MSNHVNKYALQKTVEFLTAIKPARNFANMDSLNLVAKYIKISFENSSLLATYQEYKVGDKTYQNVISSINEDKTKRIIIGAHYDVCGDMPGADDNASAIAGLLECARLISLQKETLDFRVDFVAFCLEEPPYFMTEYMGSYVHAKSLYEANSSVIAMINLEMIGYFTNKPNSQNYPIDAMKQIYPSVGDFIAIVANDESNDMCKRMNNVMQKHIKSINVTLLKPLEDITRSDHLNYWRFGFKAVMITDTADFRNPNYHTINDTLDTLDFDKMSAVVSGVATFVIGFNDNKYGLCF